MYEIVPTRDNNNSIQIKKQKIHSTKKQVVYSIRTAFLRKLKPYNFKNKFFNQSNFKPFKAIQALRYFSVVASNASTFALITKAFASFVKMYLLLLFLRVLLSWFPMFNWDTQPWISLRQVTDPYLNIFRGLVPPLMGQMDLTPLIGFYLLQMLSSILMAPFADDTDMW